MSEELVVKHCSPTLAGLKVGNLFSCKYSNLSQVVLGVRKLNKILVQRGIKVVPVKVENGRALIYVYRPSQLDKIIKNVSVIKILKNFGYPKLSNESAVKFLSERIKKSNEFPHEIGIFLGYPVEDVKGFIENKGKECKCCGTWKVYVNVEEAVKSFERFEKCNKVYFNKWSEGFAFERLAVKI